MGQTHFTLAAGGAIVLLALLYDRRRRARLAAGLIPQAEVTVRVPIWTYRAAQKPFVYFPIGTLTGVSITFCPLFLFMLGGSLDRISDWRVIVCFLVTYFVPMFYMRLGGPVARHAWEHRKTAAVK